MFVEQRGYTVSVNKMDFTQLLAPKFDMTTTALKLCSLISQELPLVMFVVLI